MSDSTDRSTSTLLTSDASAAAARPVDLRTVMARFPTGVAVVTALDLAGQPWGMTCTSLCGVSLDPPTLVVCLRRGSPTLRSVLDVDAFALNLLHSDAQRTAELFASGDPDRFAQLSWQPGEESGAPHLTQSAHLVADCAVSGSRSVGDHMVVFGEVRRVTDRRQPRPLLYGMRRYARWPAAGDPAPVDR